MFCGPVNKCGIYSCGSLPGLILDGSQNAGISVQSLLPVPTGGSPSLLPTGEKQAGGGAPVLLLCCTGAVTLAAG